jgi:hypothetical protein
LSQTFLGLKVVTNITINFNTYTFLGDKNDQPINIA